MATPWEGEGLGTAQNNPEPPYALILPLAARAGPSFSPREKGRPADLVKRLANGPPGQAEP